MMQQALPAPLTVAWHGGYTQWHLIGEYPDESVLSFAKKQATELSAHKAELSGAKKEIGNIESKMAKSEALKTVSDNVHMIQRTAGNSLFNSIFYVVWHWSIFGIFHIWYLPLCCMHGIHRVFGPQVISSSSGYNPVAKAIFSWKTSCWVGKSNCSSYANTHDSIPECPWHTLLMAGFSHVKKKTCLSRRQVFWSISTILRDKLVMR